MYSFMCSFTKLHDVFVNYCVRVHRTDVVFDEIHTIQFTVYDINYKETVSSFLGRS